MLELDSNMVTHELALRLNKPTAQSRWEQGGVDFGGRWIRIYIQNAF